MADSIDHYADLAVYVRVVEHGGFTKAARQLGISTSQASRSLSRLEERLGTRLLNRTTRRVAVTEAGRTLYDRARALLSELDEAESSVRDRGEPRGTLRVTLPIHFGIRYVAPIAAAFAATWPSVKFDLSFDDRFVDLLAEGFDLAVRVGTLVDSSLVARRLGRTRILTAASPAYLAARGTPTHPSELAQHDALLYVIDGSASTWRFRGDVAVRVAGRFAANNGEGLLTAAVLGLGVARLPDTIAAPDLREGGLVRILEEWEFESPISAVYPSGRHVPPKVRAFVDFLAEKLAPAPWLECSGHKSID